MKATPEPSFPVVVLGWALRGAGVAAIFAMAAGLLGGLHWRLELLTHWMPQIAGGAALCALGLLARRDWLLALAVALAAGTGALKLTPWTSGGQADQADRPDFSVFYANVLRVNPQRLALADQIAAADPDLVVLVEVDQSWLRDLAPVLKDYGYALEQPQNDNFGVAFYSRLPVVSAELSYLGPEHGLDGPAVQATVLAQGQPLCVYGVHTLPPAAGAFAAHRDLQLDDLAERIAAAPEACLVVGDLNTSMYTQGYRHLVQTAGLRSGRAGRGHLGTWPAGFPGWLRIPIDHVLVSEPLRVTEMRVGELSGSDHLPLYAEFAWAP